MARDGFRFGSIAIGIFVALMWLIPIFSWHFKQWLPHYIAFLLFLGFGLRPLLELTGLVSLYQRWQARIDQKLHGKQRDRHRKRIDRQLRDDKYRHQRKKDPRLPKNW